MPVSHSPMLRPPFLSRPVLTAVFAALLLPPAGLLSAAAPAAAPAVVPAAPVRMIAPGPFQPNWNSLVHRSVPGLVPRRQARVLGPLGRAIRA